MKYARNVNDISVDVRTESPEGFFTPEIAAEFVRVPDDVENGWILENGAWTAPPTPEPTPEPVPTPTEALKVSPIEFKLLFTMQERVAIKVARATDPIVDDFLEIVEDVRLTHVNLSLSSTKEGVNYLESVGLIGEGRAALILSNTQPQ